MRDDAIARIYPSAARRWFGTVTLGILGALLVWTALANPSSDFIWTAILLGFGAICMWGAIAAYQATGRGIELTKDGLFDTDGLVLAKMEDIRSVVSGPLAFKPSNGFTVRLKTPHKIAWAPGLWWRTRRMIGVGGMTTGLEGKYMAEMISNILTERDGKT